MRLLESAREDILTFELIRSGDGACPIHSWADSGDNLMNRTVFWNNLASLKWLKMPCTDLSGPISPEIAQLTTLQELHLWGTSLSGPVPIEIGQLTNLQELQLNKMKLSGLVPTEIGQLRKLTKLDLSHNNLSGTVPPKIFNMTQLKRLDLSDNELIYGGLVAAKCCVNNMNL